MSNKPLKDKDFIHLPEYPGGKKALQQFIRENLSYPKNALDNQTEGTVLVQFRIGYDGSVSELKVLKGIGDGCDEEAVRVVKMLKFSQQQNRGVKLTTLRKMKINFKLPAPPLPKRTVPGLQVTYEMKKDKKTDTVQAPVTYSYTVKFN